MTQARKKLIEVSIPLEAINKEALRRKQKAPKGFPTAIHKYWAQRPIALCRAVLFSQLVDDPDSCIDEFPTAEERLAERDRLHKLIERLISWDNSLNETVLTEARYEIARSVARARNDKLPPLAEIGPQRIVDYVQQYAPPVCDPFSGAGSIPLEAQRLGLRVNSSDLNPVAVLIGKALIEFPPKFANRKAANPEVDHLRHWERAQGLAEDIRYYGRWMREQAEAKIGHLYPEVQVSGDRQGIVTAWLWTRTVRSPDPRAQGIDVPLASTFLLSSKAGKEVIVRPVVDHSGMRWHFEIEEKPSKADIEKAKKGTKAGRATFTCLLTGAPIIGEYIDAEAQAGRMSERLMAVVAERGRGRVYLPPTLDQVVAAEVARKLVADQSDVMNLPTHECRGTFASNAQGRRFKFKTFADYFTSRQLIALATFSDLIPEVRKNVEAAARKDWSGPRVQTQLIQ